MTSIGDAGIARVKVFTSDGNDGNEAAVLLQRNRRVPDREMFEVARALGTPVTAFVESQVARHSVRFFTQRIELPFCGHGSLAAGAVLSSLYAQQHVELTTRSGIIAFTSAAADFAAIQLALTGRCTDAFDRDGLLRALRLPNSAIAAGLPFVVTDEHSPKCLVPVSAADVLEHMAPDFSALAAWSERSSVNGAYVYSLDANGLGADQARARSFNPRSGQNEDRATGIAAAALGRVLCGNSQSTKCFVVRQGSREGGFARLYVRSLGISHVELGGMVRLDDATDLYRKLSRV